MKKEIVAKSQTSGNLVEDIDFVSSPVRSPAVIAAEINIIKSQTAGIIQVLGTQINNGIFEIGRLLCEAKEVISHGEWGTWLKENVDYSDSTAQSFMKVYREFSDGQVDLLTGKTQAELFGNLDTSKLLELFKLPKSERAQLAEDNDLSKMSVRDIKKLVKEHTELSKKVIEQGDIISDLEKSKNEAECKLSKLESDVKEGKDKAKSESDKLKKDLKEARTKLDELTKSPPAAEISEDEIKRIKAEAIAESEAKYKADLQKASKDAELQADIIRAEAEAEANKRIEEMRAKFSAASDDSVKSVNFHVDQINKHLLDVDTIVAGASPEIADKLRQAIFNLLTAAAESWRVDKR